MKVTHFVDGLSGIRFAFPSLPLHTPRAFVHPIYYQPFTALVKDFKTFVNQRTELTMDARKLLLCAIIYHLSDHSGIKEPIFRLAPNASIHARTLHFLGSYAPIVRACRMAYFLAPEARTRIPHFRIQPATSLDVIFEWANLVNDLRYLDLSRPEQIPEKQQRLYASWCKFKAHAKDPNKMPESFQKFILKHIQLSPQSEDWLDIQRLGILTLSPHRIALNLSGSSDVLLCGQLLSDLITAIRDHRAEHSSALTHAIVKWLQEKLSTLVSIFPDIGAQLLEDILPGNSNSRIRSESLNIEAPTILGSANSMFTASTSLDELLANAKRSRPG